MLFEYGDICMHTKCTYFYELLIQIPSTEEITIVPANGFELFVSSAHK